VWRAKVTGNEGKSKWKFGLVLRMPTFRKLASAKLTALGCVQIPMVSFCPLPASQSFCFAKATQKEQSSHSSEYHFSTFITQ
jgi:hypothetical protein